VKITRLVVLVSGYGSNLQAILDACAGGELAAQVVAVISNRMDAYGLERARQAEVPAITHPRPKGVDRREYDQSLAEVVLDFEPDFIILAGWMLILSSTFLDHFPDQVVNLHPALPGTFPGTHAIEHAYNAFQQGEIQHTGVMVHLVPDEGVDDGPVLAQEIVPIYPEDSLEILEERVHRIEHHLLIQAIGSLITGNSSAGKQA